MPCNLLRGGADGATSPTSHFNSPLPDNHSTHGIEVAEEQGANKLLTNCPSCILFLEQGLIQYFMDTLLKVLIGTKLQK